MLNDKQIPSCHRVLNHMENVKAVLKMMVINSSKVQKFCKLSNKQALGDNEVV